MNKIYKTNLKHAFLCILASTIILKIALGQLSLALPFMLLSTTFIIKLFFKNWKNRGGSPVEFFGFIVNSEDYRRFIYGSTEFFFIDSYFLLHLPCLMISLSLVTLVSKIMQDDGLNHPGFYPSIATIIFDNNTSIENYKDSYNPLSNAISYLNLFSTLALWAAFSIMPFWPLSFTSLRIIAASAYLITTSIIITCVDTKIGHYKSSPKYAGKPPSPFPFPATKNVNTSTLVKIEENRQINTNPSKVSSSNTSALP